MTLSSRDGGDLLGVTGCLSCQSHAISPEMSSSFFKWVANFAITMTFRIMLTSIGRSGAYAICAGVSAWFAHFFLTLWLRSFRTTRANGGA